MKIGDRIYSAIGYEEEKPIAWMPLPEPYKEEISDLVEKILEAMRK